MNILQYVPDEEPPKRSATQWSVGIAMFAAFVLPFVLLIASAPYRQFLAQTKAKLVKTQQIKFTDSELESDSSWIRQDD